MHASSKATAGEEVGYPTLPGREPIGYNTSLDTQRTDTYMCLNCVLDPISKINSEECLTSHV